MATLGQQLTQEKADKRREEIARNSDIMRQYVKVDLLNRLQERIAAGYGDYAPLLAPKEIRPLFAAELSIRDPLPLDASTAYREVWEELKAWAKSEDLYISTGIDLSKDGFSRPHDLYDWGASLRLVKAQEPVPQKPTPPQPVKTTQGVILSPGEVTVIVVLLTALLALFTLYIVRT